VDLFSGGVEEREREIEKAEADTLPFTYLGIKVYLCHSTDIRKTFSEVT